MSGNEKTSTTDTSSKAAAQKGGDKAPVGTEAARAGGVESAQRQAERDWQNSAKESGE